MIFVEIECGNTECPNGSELIDVYHMHWKLGTPISSYLPEGWTVNGGDESDLPIVRCPDCSGGSIP